MINLKFFSVNQSISNNRRWFQVVIIIVVLIASTMVSFWGSRNIYLLLLLMLVGIAVLLVLLRQLNIGFLLVFLGGMFVPVIGPSGMSAATVMIVFMLGLWIMNMFIIQRNITFVRSSVIMPVVVFLAISLLAFLLGQIPWFVFARQAPLSAQVGGFSIFIFSIGGMLLAANLIKDVRWLKIIVWTYIGLFSIYVISRTLHLNIIAGLYHPGFTAQSMSWTWFVTLVVGQIIFNLSLSRRARWALIAVVMGAFYLSIINGYDWKSGWVPALVSAGLLIGLRYRKLFLYAIPVAGLVVLYLAIDLIGGEGYSWGTRVDAWKILLEIGRVSPLLGMGFANYYWYTPLFPIRGWKVSFNSHNQYIDLIAETGYVGLFVFIWLFFELGRLCWRLTKQLPSGFTLGYVYSVLAGICATLVAAFLGDWVLPFVYNVGLAGFRASIIPWIFIGGVMAVEQMILQNPEKLADESLVRGNLE
jgi:hypothetical protein